VEIGKSSIVPLISAHACNAPLTIIGPSVAHRVGIADSALTVAVNSPIRANRDLNGKPVSVAGLKDMQWLATHARTPRSFQPIVNAAAKYNVIEKAFNAQDLIFRLNA
jgi:hypothetical protein